MDAGLRVTGPANCSPDANTAVSTLLQSWTAIDSSSPAYTCPQLASWIRALGARESDEEITENAESWAREMYYEMKLKRGQSWIRIDHFSFFCEHMQLPVLYAKMFWEAIDRDDVAVVRPHLPVPHTPVVNCDPRVRGYAG